MIQLHSDCLVFETADGETIPCTAEQVTVELIGEAAQWLDPELVRNASQAVLHYFKSELGRNFVSVSEFSRALERVLMGFGFHVTAGETPPAAVVELDLRLLASEASRGFELAFFQRLRQEVLDRLREAPRMLRFKGLRGCVKQLAGARRWGRRCQQLDDQIVDYLRTCLATHPGGTTCSLMVR